VSDLYPIPPTWQWVELKDVAEVVTGNTPLTSDPGNYGGDIPFFKPPQLKDTPVSSAPDTLSIQGTKNSRLLPAKAVLVSCIGNLGKTALTKIPSATNQQINALILYPPVDAVYGFYYTQTLGKWLTKNSSATTVSIVNKGKFETAPFPVAPAAEQTRIVEKLEELLTDLDAGVAELKAAQKKLGQYRQSLLKAAVEGALTAEWRAARKSVRPELVEGRSTLTSSSDHPSTGSGRTDEEETGAQLLQRILIERRARWEAKQLAKFAEQGKAPPKGWQLKYPEPVQPDTSGLPKLPEGWVWASVEQLGHVQLGRQRSPSKVGKANPTPYIRAANITEDGVDLSDVLEMDFSETEKETFALKVGDVLLTEASGSPEHVGRPAIWKHAAGLYCFQNTVLRFSPEGISSEYAFYSFLAMQKLGVFGKLSGGVGINHLSAGKFSKLPVPLPPTDEQVALIEIIKAKFSLCDEQLIYNTHSLKQSAAQRKNILKAAFSGQLVPQDPNDEPASVLLERIRAERAGREAMKKPRGRKTKETR